MAVGEKFPVVMGKEKAIPSGVATLDDSGILIKDQWPPTVKWQSNKNLLDNSYFIGGGSQQGHGEFPINQRGQTEYIGHVYTIDRWATEGTTIKVGDDGLQLENPSESAVQFVTNFEASRLIDNQVYTASLLVKDLIGSGAMVIQYREGAFTYVLAAPLSDGLISESGNLSTSGVNLLGYMIVLHPNSSVKLIAAKLELGPTQTLAHKDATGNWVLNDPPPDYGLELLKCQRYQLFGPLYGYKVWPYHSTYAGFIFSSPVYMAKNPTLVGSIEYRKHGTETNTIYAGTPVFESARNSIYTFLDIPDIGNVDLIYIPEGSGLDANI